MDGHFLCKGKRLLQPIRTTHPLSPWKSRRALLLFVSQELNSLIGFGPCRTCFCRRLGQDVLLFLKEPVCGNSHSGQPSAAHYKSPLRRLNGDWRVGGRERRRQGLRSALTATACCLSCIWDGRTPGNQTGKVYYEPHLRSKVILSAALQAFLFIAV